MAIRHKTDNRYIKITGLTASAVPGEEPIVNTAVSYTTFRNQQERQNPDPDFPAFKCESRTFDRLPFVADNPELVLSDYNRLITAGYILLKEVFTDVEWEGC